MSDSTRARCRAVQAAWAHQCGARWGPAGKRVWSPGVDIERTADGGDQAATGGEG